VDFRRLFPILLILFTNILGAGVIIPILPLYAEGQFAGTVVQITLLSALFFGAQFLAAPWLGSLSDRFGRRPVLLVSQMGTVVAFVIFIFAGPLGQAVDSIGWSLPLTGGMLMLFVARVVDGITGGNITAAQAYISDITTDENRAAGLGYLQGAFGVGFIFGPALGGVMASFGPVAPFIAAAAITAGTFLLTLFTLKESLPPEERFDHTERTRILPSPRIFMGDRLLALILAVAFIGSLAFSVLPATFALYADRVLFPSQPVGQGAEVYIGLMLTFNGLVTVVTQVALLRPLVERLRERRVLLLGEIALAIGMFGLGFFGGAVVVTLFLAPFAFGQGTSQPPLQALITRMGQGRSRGEMLGYYQAARSLALIAGPIWGGFVFEAISPQAVYQIGGVVMLVAVALAILLLRQDLPRPAQGMGSVERPAPVRVGPGDTPSS
jgi:DHA1 family tetracycline resistance protein-like MFS transporter